MMEWNDWLRILRWRAVEEGDSDGSILSLERRRQATARASAGLTSEDVNATPLGEREVSYLSRRSYWLETEALGWRDSLIRLLGLMRVPRVRPTLVWLGWLFAAGVGYSMLSLGQESEFNLLALPLVGILLWNALMILGGLAAELMPVRKNIGIDLNTAEHRLPKWVIDNGKIITKGKPPEPEILERFRQLAWPLAWTRMQRRFRAWLHIGAALIAIGGCVSLYAQGWSKEYRVVWESTLLNEESAARFFGALFAPASGFLGLEIPLDEIPHIQRGASTTGESAPALPWLHLYAGTLVILIVLPRTLLAALAMARSKQVTRAHARHLAWDDFLRRQLRSVEGGEETLTVLVHASDMTEAQTSSWTKGLQDRLGGSIKPAFHLMHPGDEEDYLNPWQPRSPRVIVVFHLATTPEEEVHGDLMKQIHDKVNSVPGEPDITVLLEASGPAAKWSKERFESREKLWTRLLKRTARHVWVSSRRELDPSESLPPAKA